MKKLINLLNKCYRKDIILVYTMGKVGSSSLENNIDGSFHLHSLYNNPPNPLHWELRNFGIKNKVSIILRNFLRRMIFRTASSIKIITIVRPPMQRNISMFFQALPFWLSSAQSGYNSNKHIDARREGFDILCESFEEYFNHEYCLTWLDDEIKRFSGIDVYLKPFQSKKGYNIYKNGKYECLLMSLDKLNENEHILSEFVNQDVKIESINSGEMKWYSNVYKKFKSEYESSENLYEILNNSKYNKHFFKEY